MSIRENRCGAVMTEKKILVVDDEKDILELIRYNLAKENYKIESAMSGEEALSRARADLPDLIVLDLMLPGVDGLDVCRLLKNDSRTSKIPIIMLTAKGEDADVVAGLELGADDYVTKPFSPRVLTARVRAVLRRNIQDKNDEQVAFSVHDLVMDPGRRSANYKKKAIDLTASEFSILYLLARRPGWVFTRKQIIDSVKGDDYAVTERSVDVQIVGLRKKLADAGDLIQTVRGVGYRFRE